MPRYYVDLDNNRLLTGPSSTQLAATPRLWQGDKPVIELELLTREDGVLGHYTSTASAINVRVGTLGGTAVASALTLSTVTLSAQATATAGMTAAVTATGTASLLGSITATATLGVNSPSVVTITPSVTTFASAQAVAHLGPEAIAPDLVMARNPVGDRYLHVREAGTPYDAATVVYANATSAAQDLSYNETASIVALEEWTTSPSVTHAFLYRHSGWNSAIVNVFTISSNNIQAVTSNSVFFLTTNGTWIDATAITALSLINIKDKYSFNVPYGTNYIHEESSPGTGGIYVNFGGQYPAVAYNVFRNPENADSYGMIVLRSSQVSSALTTSFPYTLFGVSVASLGINFGIPGVYTQTLNQNAFGGLVYGDAVRTYSNVAPQDFAAMQDLNEIGGGGPWSGLMEVRTCASISRQNVALGLSYPVTVASKGIFSGQDITINFETMPDGRKLVAGGQVQIDNYRHWPSISGNKNVPVLLDPDRAYRGRRVQTIEISSCGSQYATPPTILISEPEDENGVTAKATAQINGGKLSGITITDPGSGYSSAPDVFVMPPVSQMKYGVPRSVTSVITAVDRRLVLAMASGTTLSENSWAMLNGLGNANGLAYVVSVATGGSQTTLKFPYDLGTVTSVGTASLTPLVPYVRVTGATISGTDASFAPGSTVPVTFSTPSCGDTDAVANFTVLNSGQLSLSSIPTPGYATAFSVATLSAYRKVTGITVTCAGAGYWTTLPAITIDNAAYVATAPGATPAVVTASLNGNGSISLTIVSAGYGYNSAPTITVEAPNQGDGVRVVTLVTRGVGYSDGTFACTVSAPPAGGAQAVVNFVKSGTSQGFVVVNAGRGYLAAPAVTVAAPDIGGQVSGLTVTCQGAGYDAANPPQITFSGGGGTGAAATPVLLNGEVTGLTITSAGSGYTSAPAVSVEAPETSVFYRKQIDLSTAAVTTLLGAGSSASAFLQIEEKAGADSTVLAQVPVTLVARVG